MAAKLYLAADIKSLFSTIAGSTWSTSAVKDTVVDAEIEFAQIEMRTLVDPSTVKSSFANLLWAKMALYRCALAIKGAGDPATLHLYQVYRDYLEELQKDRAADSEQAFEFKA